jgi:hypothetical protein
MEQFYLYNRIKMKVTAWDTFETKKDVTTDEIFPIQWKTDRPLDYHVQPPYTLKKWEHQQIKSVLLNGWMD